MILDLLLRVWYKWIGKSSTLISVPLLWLLLLWDVDCVEIEDDELVLELVLFEIELIDDIDDDGDDVLMDSNNDCMFYILEFD